MADAHQVTILANGVQAWNAWRKENEYTSPDLREINLAFSDLRTVDLSDCVLLQADLGDSDLREANLRDADLVGANLQNANLANADLARADFTHSTLLGANLSWTRLVYSFLTEADLLGADLTGADLSNADLSRADLIGCDLRFAKLLRNALFETDFHGATFGETSITDCNLADTKDLEFAVHSGPSNIDIQTIYKSGANIPDAFLRGCGVPDSFIAQMHSLVAAEGRNRFYSCFISYSFKDDDFVRRLHSRMLDAHLRVWYAPEDAQSGKKLHEQIETAIQRYDKLLIVLSETSLRSEWVMTELRKAFRFETQSGKRKLFPIRLVDMATLRGWECFDPDSGKDLAVELRGYLIPDFSNWHEDWQFEAAFSRLLNDLRNEDTAP